MLGSSPLTRGKQPTQALRPVGEFDHYVKRTPGCPFGQSRCPRCRAILLSEWTAFLTPTCDIVSLELIPAHAGKTRRHLNRPRPARLIPAHAGKTHTRHLGSRLAGAHPRSRGENLRFGGLFPPDDGSSPLARGKHGGHEVRRQRRRLIPARAGKTPTARSPCCSPSAHPRSRGENGAALAAGCLYTGSSPLARGKPLQGRAEEGLGGLIPARAGKTDTRESWTCLLRAHPRSRGENSCSLTSKAMLSGSSPLARGKPQARRQPNPRVRLIPARAGKTGQPSQSAASGSAHPRSRGENNPSSNSSRRTTGSSPLARGKQGPRNEDGLARRLIPARAGKTRSWRGRRGRPGAHPRSRGENISSR